MPLPARRTHGGYMRQRGDDAMQDVRRSPMPQLHNASRPEASHVHLDRRSRGESMRLESEREATVRAANALERIGRLATYVYLVLIAMLVLMGFAVGCLITIASTP